MGLRSTKSIASLQDDPTSDNGAPAFQRVLGPFDLTAVGIGAMIGAGIFVLTGTSSAQYAGPAVALSFLVAALGCVCVGLCFAELSTMIPAAGTAYTYTFAAFGEFAAWIVGWNLILEFIIGAAMISVSWSGYAVALLADWGVAFPAALTQAPFVADGGAKVHRVAGALANVPAMLLVLGLTGSIVLGIRPTALVNRVAVVIKVSVILLVVAVGFAYLNRYSWHPFIPPNEGAFGRFGWSGVFRASTAVFLSFIGFDAITSVTQEARNPQRDMPVAILSALVICTTLYVLVALVVTGLTPYTQLNTPHPLVTALSTAGGSGLAWVDSLIKLAIVTGLGSVGLVLLLAQPRLLFAMARDGLLPSSLGRVRPGGRTLVAPTLISGAAAALIAGFFPTGVLLEIVVLATLLSFVFVCVGVLVLRYRRPNVQRPFRVPLVPVIPLLGAVFSTTTMLLVPWDSWLRLLMWAAIGVVVYFLYGAANSRLERSAARDTLTQ